MRYQLLVALLVIAQLLVDRHDRLVGRLADRADLVGPHGHGRPAVEDVDVVLPGEALGLEHPHRGAAGGVGNADHVARGLAQHRDIDRMLGHQISNELVAELGVELVGVLEIHPEETARDPVPERRSAGLVDHSAQLGEAAVGKAVAVIADEQIAAAGDQHAKPAGTLAGVQEQPADFGRSLKIG